MPRRKVPRVSNLAYFRAHFLKEKPKACPFCGQGGLIPSASGKHVLCRKCGRIVIAEKARRH